VFARVFAAPDQGAFAKANREFVERATQPERRTGRGREGRALRWSGIPEFGSGRHAASGAPDRSFVADFPNRLLTTPCRIGGPLAATAELERCE
jgi:hypothetical protein